MRLTVFLMILAVLPSTARAASWWDWIFPPPVPDFTRMQHRDGKTPQPLTYAADQARIASWVGARGGPEALMNDLYADDILRSWDPEQDVPELTVGRNFMRLSDQDRQDVAAFVDRFYKVTQSGGVFHIVHWHSDKPIGLYDGSGLRLQ